MYIAVVTNSVRPANRVYLLIENMDKCPVGFTPLLDRSDGVTG